MLIISYDIQKDKTRTRFAKYLSKYGYRLQYSVFCIENSQRIIDIIKDEIEVKFLKLFKESDSVMIYSVDDSSMIKYGYAKHEDDDLIIV